jgi:hypothetical protein
MHPDPVATATDAIRELVNRKVRPLSWLEATFAVVEAMTTEKATATLAQLIRCRFLSVYDADLAQMLAQKLGVEVRWSHARFNADGWNEGRGYG